MYNPVNPDLPYKSEVYGGQNYIGRFRDGMSFTNIA